MEFENAFSRPGKVMNFRENGQGHGKVMEFHLFGPKISCRLKTWKNSPSHRAKICLQKSGFSVFLSHGKFKLVMEKSLNFIAQFLYEPCVSQYKLMGLGWGTMTLTHFKFL